MVPSLNVILCDEGKSSMIEKTEIGTIVPNKFASRTNENWTEGEEALLYELRSWQGLPFRTIGQRLNRSPESCEKKYRRTQWTQKTFYNDAKCRLKEGYKAALAEQIAETNNKNIDNSALATEMLVDRIEEVVKALPVAQKKVYVPTRGKPQQHCPEDVGLILSDTHIGHHHTLEETGGLSEYSFEIFKKRAEFMKTATADIVSLHSQLYKLPNLHIFCPGDIVAGMNNVGNWSPTYINMTILDQSFEGMEAISDMIYYWLGLFDKVYFYGVGGNHGKCNDKNTKILTPDGYKRYDEIKVGDLVGTINKETRKFEFQPVQKVHIIPKEPSMLRMKTNNLDIRHTLDHDVLLVKRKSSNIQEKCGQRSLTTIRARDLTRGTESVYTIPICANHGKSVSSIEKKMGEIKAKALKLFGKDVFCDLLKLLGIIMADGCYPPNPNHVKITIYQSKEDKVDEIRELLKLLGAPFAESSRTRKPPVILGTQVQSTKLCFEFILPSNGYTKFLLDILPIKSSIPSWMYALNEIEVKALLDGIVLGDGVVREDRKREDDYTRHGGIDTVWGEKTFLEQLSGLLISHGISCAINRHKRKIAKILKDGSEQESYYLQVRKTNHYHFHSHQITEEPYNDLAWCVTVDNGTIAVMSESGDAYFTGNCAAKGVEKEYVNWDYLTYKFIEARFKDNPKVHFVVPKTWWIFTEIRNHKFLIIHGDDIRGGLKAVEESTEKIASIIKDIPDYTIAGHFHSASDYSTNFGRVLLNGSWMGGDIFSMKSLRKANRPEQKIFGIHDKRGITWSYNLDLSIAR